MTVFKVNLVLDSIFHVGLISMSRCMYLNHCLFQGLELVVHLCNPMSQLKPFDESHLSWTLDILSSVSWKLMRVHECEC